MNIRVRISVEITETNGEPISRIGSHPHSLAWNHAEGSGDNPRFYGDSVQSALVVAAAKAVNSVEAYVDLRSDSPGQLRETMTYLGARKGSG